MKPINFVNPLSPRQQASHKWWIKTSSGIALSCGIILVGITGRQLYTLFNLKREVDQWQKQNSPFATTMEKKQHLRQQEQAIKDKIATITAYKNDSSDSAQLIQALYTTIAQQGTTISITLDSKAVECGILCQSIQQATQIITNLGSITALKNPQLIALQQQIDNNTKMLRITVQAGLKKER